jgi:DNA replication and repair protein RecF
MDVALPRGLVWVSGANGAGKTTLLEAMYLLDRGRTFRGRRGGSVTTWGAEATHIQGWVMDERGRRQERRWHTKGADVDRGTVDLTRFVGASTYSIVEGDPGLRRRLFDWSLFHVEQDARGMWTKLDRLQRQRNAWLRSGGRGLAVWDGPYAAELEGVWERRFRFVSVVNEVFRTLTSELFPEGPLEVAWRRQGQVGSSEALLAAHLDTDRARGFTFLSSSRGDVVMLKDGREWRGSRGENKLAGILLQLALQRVLASRTGIRPAVLLDDPYAEVTASSLEPVLAAWAAIADQVIVTGLSDAPAANLSIQPAAWFHVERGELRAC